MKNKTAVITGDSEGLGKQIAFGLVREGVKVILLARRKKQLSETAHEISKLGGYCRYYVCDVSSQEQVKKTVADILEAFPRIDILVNNAGVYWEGATEKVGFDEAYKMVSINTLGTIFVTQALLPHFKKNNRGQILSVISVSGLHPEPDYGIYAASKYGQRGFVESLRQEQANTHIKVMGIYPEGIDTGIFKKAGLHYTSGESWMMRSEDVARVAVFMFSQPDDVNLSEVVVRKIE